LRIGVELNEKFEYLMYSLFDCIYYEKSTGLLSHRCYWSENGMKRKMTFGQRVKYMWKNFYQINDEENEK
jgi:hypothetical protein